MNGLPASAYASQGMGAGWTRLSSWFVAGGDTGGVAFVMSCGTPGIYEVDDVNVTKVGP